MASAVGNEEGPVTSINVTPLVDILLVVLIIFMATAPLIGKRAMKVDVPRAAHHDRAATDAVQVVYNAKREISLGGKVMSQQAMATALAQTVQTQPDLNVTFSADKGIDYGAIIGVLDAIRGAGVRKIGLEVVNR